MALEEAARIEAEKKEWQDKLVVDDPVLHISLKARDQVTAMARERLRHKQDLALTSPTHATVFCPKAAIAFLCLATLDLGAALPQLKVPLLPSHLQTCCLSMPLCAAM